MKKLTTIFTLLFLMLITVGAEATVTTIYPNGAGEYTDFAIVTGCASNWQCTDEVGAHDGNTSYVHSLNAGDNDSYTLDDIDIGIDHIQKITVYVVMRPGGTGCPTVTTEGQITIRVADTTDYQSSSFTFSDCDWIENSNEWILNPTTSLPWTEADINALEAGAKHTVDHGIPTFRVTQVRVEVTHGKPAIVGNPVDWGYFNDTGALTIIGEGFEASQGSGGVRICTTAGCGTAYDQTESTWSDTEITINSPSTGSLSSGTTYYFEITTDSGVIFIDSSIFDDTHPTISGYEDKEGNTLEGATEYKHDSVYITTNEACLDPTGFIGITSKDNTDSDDVTNNMTMYDEAGTIRADPDPIPGFSTADTPHFLNIGTELKDCAGNNLVSPTAMSTGWTPSDTVQENDVLIDTLTAQRIGFGQQAQAIYDGRTYYVFACNGTDIDYYATTDRVTWTKGATSFGNCNSGDDFDVTLGTQYNYQIFLAYEDEATVLVRDFDDSKVLIENTEAVTDGLCGVAGGNNLTSAVHDNADLHIAFRLAGTPDTIRTCVSQGAREFIDFSAVSTTVTPTNDPLAIQLVYDGSVVHLFYQEAGASNYDIHSRYWTGSAWSAEESPLTDIARGFKVVVTATKINLIYQDTSNNIMHETRTKGSGGTYSGSPVDTGANSGGNWRLTATATYENDDGVVVFDVSGLDIDRTVYDGSSWGTETTLATTSDSTTFGITAPDKEHEVPFVVYHTLSGGDYFLRTSYLGQTPAGNHDPGTAGETLTIRGDSGGQALEPTYFRYIVTGGQDTCMNYQARSRQMRVKCIDNQTLEWYGDGIVSDRLNHLDAHGNTTIAIDNDETSDTYQYVSVCVGGRETFTLHDDPLMCTKSLLAISDPNFKPYMWEPLIDTGLTPATATRGYKFNNFIDGVQHMVVSNPTNSYISNDENGSWGSTTNIVDLDCITSTTFERMYIQGVETAPDGSIGIIWTWTDTNLANGGQSMYYARLTYSGGTYSATEADKSTSMTLPMQPTETGCAGDNQKVYDDNGGSVDAGTTSGGLFMDEDSHPHFIFHYDAVATFKPDELWFAKYKNGEGASGNCQADWKCVDLSVTVDSNARSRLLLTTQGLSEVHNAIYAEGGDIKRMVSTDDGETFTAGVTLLNDATYGLKLKHVETGKTNIDFLFVYDIHKTEGSYIWLGQYWQELYMQNITFILGGKRNGVNPYINPGINPNIN